jgi:hypothetical protein
MEWNLKTASRARELYLRDPRLSASEIRRFAP